MVAFGKFGAIWALGTTYSPHLLAPWKKLAIRKHFAESTNNLPIHTGIAFWNLLFSFPQDH